MFYLIAVCSSSDCVPSHIQHFPASSKNSRQSNLLLDSMSGPWMGEMANLVDAADDAAVQTARMIAFSLLPSAMRTGLICFALQKKRAISTEIEKFTSHCRCDAVVHLPQHQELWRDLFCAFSVGCNKVVKLVGLVRMEPSCGFGRRTPVHLFNDKLSCNPDQHGMCLRPMPYNGFQLRFLTSVRNVFLLKFLATSSRRSEIWKRHVCKHAPPANPSLLLHAPFICAPGNTLPPFRRAIAKP